MPNFSGRKQRSPSRNRLPHLALIGHKEGVCSIFCVSLKGQSRYEDTPVALSYTPEKIPDVWASATVGNYDRNELAFGNTSSEIYGVSTNGEYWSIAAGLDVTNWFWNPEFSSGNQLRSVKLLYRYTESLAVDDTLGTTDDRDGLVAMMVQRKF